MAKGGRRAHAGRPRKPTTMKVVQGTFREDRHGAETQAPTEFPKAPKHLSVKERAYWKQMEALVGTWTAKSDVFAINGVVSLFERILHNQQAQRQSAEAGHPLAFKYTITSDGEADEQKDIQVEAKENPLITQEIKLWRELRAYIGITGLSPVDRARVKPAGEEQTKPSALQDLMRRSRS
jgi:hypothetical protein